MTLLVRITFGEHVRIKTNKYKEGCTGPWAMLYVVTWTPIGNKDIGGQSYPTLGTFFPYLGHSDGHLRNPSYPTFTDKVICGLRGKLSDYCSALRYIQSHFVWHKMSYRESRRASKLR